MSGHTTIDAEAEGLVPLNLGSVAAAPHIFLTRSSLLLHPDWLVGHSRKWSYLNLLGLPVLLSAVPPAEQTIPSGYPVTLEGNVLFTIKVPRAPYSTTASPGHLSLNSRNRSRQGGESTDPDYGLPPSSPRPSVPGQSRDPPRAASLRIVPGETDSIERGFGTGLLGRSCRSSQRIAASESEDHPPPGKRYSDFLASRNLDSIHKHFGKQLYWAAGRIEKFVLR